MDKLYYQYNPWWDDAYRLCNIFPRDKYINKLERHLSDRLIVFLSGLRRVGKTTLMKLLIQKLIEKNIDSKLIFYISLDDYLIKDKSIIEILDDFRTIHKIPFGTKIYVFLDEITYKDDFHQQLKNIYDNQNVKIFATSSSSIKLKDKKAFLTGRSLLIDVTSLDFQEYLVFKNINIKKQDSNLLESYFKEFLQTGGIPEFVLTGEREYLNNLIDDILYKDIISQHNIKNPQLIKDYFLLLMERSGKQLSINKIANILKISPDTSKKYLSYFENTYLIYLVSRFGKTNEKILAPKKIYASDTGIKHTFTGYRDLGSFFENYVYLKIKNLDPSYIYINGIELDFILKDKCIIEAKYNTEMTKKQKELFNEIKVKKKLLVDNVYKLQDLDSLISDLNA